MCLLKHKYILYLIQIFGCWNNIGLVVYRMTFLAICLHLIHILPSLVFFLLQICNLLLYFALQCIPNIFWGLMLVIGQCWLLCAFAFCWMRAYSVENVWTFYYMIVYFMLWSMSKCILYSWVYGSIFCPRRPFSNRSKHKSSKSCHQPQYAIQNTTIRNTWICNT